MGNIVRNKILSSAKTNLQDWYMYDTTGKLCHLTGIEIRMRLQDIAQDLITVAIPRTYCCGPYTW